MSDCVRKVPYGDRRESDDVMKVSVDDNKGSDGVRMVQEGVRWC